MFCACATADFSSHFSPELWIPQKFSFFFLLIQDISSWDMSSQTDTLFLPFYMKKVSQTGDTGGVLDFPLIIKPCVGFFLNVFVALSSVLWEEDACCCLFSLESLFQERVFL